MAKDIRVGSFSSSMKSLRVYSRQREEQAQRRWGGNKFDMLKELW